MLCRWPGGAGDLSSSYQTSAAWGNSQRGKWCLTLPVEECQLPTAPLLQMNRKSCGCIHGRALCPILHSLRVQRTRRGYRESTVRYCWSLSDHPKCTVRGEVNICLLANHFYSIFMIRFYSLLQVIFFSIFKSYPQKNIWREVSFAKV